MSIYFPLYTLKLIFSSVLDVLVYLACAPNAVNGLFINLIASLMSWFVNAVSTLIQSAVAFGKITSVRSGSFQKS